MATKPPDRQIPKPEAAVLKWLLDSDPSIRWQTMRDLTDAPNEEVAAERAKVATEGWGARLLARQETNGHWGGDPNNPEWTCLLSLLWLRDLGIDMSGTEARRAVERICDNVTWHWWDNKPFFEGEVYNLSLEAQQTSVPELDTGTCCPFKHWNFSGSGIVLNGNSYEIPDSDLHSCIDRRFLQPRRGSDKRPTHADATDNSTRF